ncbi:MAG: response regulator [Alphaproteobacteria bacterium]|nr:response regulator [Alphaproteobacteria bacterium]
MLQPESLDVNEVIGSVRKMLARLLGPSIVLDLRTPRTLGHVTADREQLIQVLVNLAANARDAMPEGGRLTIETVVRRLPEELGPGREPHVLVTVSDTGTGMSPEVLARIFDPFFTTKGQAGTGLGLSTSFGVISQSGGHLRARSSPGLGSVFEVWLPITPRAADAETLRPRPRREATMGRRTVLLVEDELGILMLSSRVLERAGFAVQQATTGRRALELARSEAFDLVVTDLRLPDLDGHVVGSEVRSLQPDVAVLYVSGFAGAHLSEVSGARDAFLAKPYTPDQLLAAIQQLLAQPIS